MGKYLIYRENTSQGGGGIHVLGSALIVPKEWDRCFRCEGIRRCCGVELNSPPS